MLGPAGQLDPGLGIPGAPAPGGACLLVWVRVGPTGPPLLSPTLGVPGSPGRPQVSDLDLWGTPRAQEATSSCERARSAWGQNPALDRAMGGWIPLVFLLGLGRGLKSPPPSQSPGPDQPRSPWVRGWHPVQCKPPSRRDSGRRQGTVRPLHHSPAHTLSGAPCLPSSLQPLGTLWDTRASDGSRVSREPRGG